MLTSEFIKLADAGHPLDAILRIADRNLVPGSLTEEGMKKLMKAVAAAPRAMFTEDRNAFEKRKAEYIKKWEMPELTTEFESAVDFNEQTGERIVITMEDYQQYFDNLLAEENEDNATLHVRLFSADKKEEFETLMLSSAKVEELQKKHPWLSSIAFVDNDLYFLLSYAVHLPDSSSAALQVSVAEAIARGRAQATAFIYLGKLLNRHFSTLFQDFFLESRS